MYLKNGGWGLVLVVVGVVKPDVLLERLELHDHVFVHLDVVALDAHVEF